MRHDYLRITHERYKVGHLVQADKLKSVLDGSDIEKFGGSGGIGLAKTV